ncbi:uncharacterized protein TrAFT101_004159 [Trichoderma asperellum]|uniref:DNA replication factor Cdt1 C-terminal domain-containing protein n=1 Tax=Trichoderma asperellum (strain ATCC 204424 / CBS 433.97 / NBRC 101777) TaxID=1042311 RepID=A0A2T3ZNI8_TRIA4|nr:hypothetical protein M441DRAFT_53120 [Trichoderma asperellum CBS 433.97]PTB46383.1 hypothetical protein M441DRAFT_53120 [Trichoderma asperellum CBS 433.97]UKZ88401.1 hypothetical protein TrAFT101_004159 [Trichoderma asperellum]
MARTTRRRQAEAPSTTQSISSFTRVSKSQAFHGAASKKAVIANPEPTSSRKRKAAVDEADANHPPRVTRRTVSFTPSSDEEPVPATPAKRARRGESTAKVAISAVAVPAAKPAPKTPVKGKKVAKSTPSRAASAHKPSESTIIAKSKQGGKTVQTKLEAYRVTSHKKTKEAESEFSPELVDLIRLHKAFLKTIALQIVHNGTIVPIDISSVAPHISRTWGKRQVTVDDIRVCIAVQTSTRDSSVVSPFIVSDYGRGKICIELHPDHNNGAVSINEERLCRQFEENLRAFCAGRTQDNVTDVDVPPAGLSLKELPRAEIRNMDNSIKINPILNKGHNALSALKEGIVAKQQEKEVKQQATTAMVNPDGTKMSLLDRLRHKQLAKANGPLPPSEPELQRRAALNRVTDVCATISMLSLSNPASLPRQAFTMTLISDKLKDSLRVPLSKEEGMNCIRLIANEIAPEWLKVVTIGGRENVVIQRGLQPVDRVIQERVQKLLA